MNQTVKYALFAVFTAALVIACGNTPENPMKQSAALQLIILGGPGAGKGTQAEKIVSQFGLAHISTGSILREEVAEGTELGKRVAEVMESGELVADSIVLRLVEKRLTKADCDSGFILDGFPRTIPQAEGLDAILERQNKGTVHVVYLEVSDGEMQNRLLSRGRADDTAETIKNRIEIFHQQTDPLIELYASRKQVITINGEQAIDSVFADVQVALEPLR